MSSLTHQTVFGLVWTFLQTSGVRLLQLAGQFALAWYLAPGEFGVLGTALAIFSLVQQCLELGIRSVLVQRQAELARLANAGFWLSLLAGLAASLILLAIAGGLVLRSAGEPVAWLLVWFAAGPPGIAVATVPRAILQARLQFRTLTLVNLGEAAVRMGLTVGLAAGGWGAASFPIAVAVASPLVAVWAIKAARPALFLRLDRPYWPELLPASGWMIAAGALFTFTTQVDYLLLASMSTDAAVGVYFFAFSVSQQVLGLFVAGFNSVLLPVLARLSGEPIRQALASLRAARLLALAGLPVCLLQALLAGPVLRGVFGQKWEPSILLVQILSIGMMGRVMSLPSGVLLPAQGRFRHHFWLLAIYAAGFVTVAWIGCVWRDAVGLACAVAGYLLLVEPVFIWLRTRESRVQAQVVWKHFAGPFAAAVSVAGLTAFVAHLLYTGGAGHWLQAIGITATFILLYGLVLYGMFADEVASVYQVLRGRGVDAVRQ